jgi:tetratricopeptide (TPR) repeat protein
MPEAKDHYMKGLALFGQDKHKEAIAEYEKALELQPQWTDAMHALAMAHMSAGTLDDAIRIGNEIVEIDKEDAFAHTSLSMFYQRKGMIEEAEKEAAKARMISWKEELKTNPNAAPPGPAGSMDIIQ